MNPAAQRRKALRKANETRVKGKEFRQEVAGLKCCEGWAMLAAFLENEDRPDAVGRMRLDQFLRSALYIGPVAEAMMLRRAGIHRKVGVHRNRTRRPLQVRDLTAGERSRLGAELRERIELYEETHNGA